MDKMKIPISLARKSKVERMIRSEALRVECKPTALRNAASNLRRLTLECVD